MEKNSPGNQYFRYSLRESYCEVILSKIALLSFTKKRFLMGTKTIIRLKRQNRAKNEIEIELIDVNDRNAIKKMNIN